MTLNDRRSIASYANTLIASSGTDAEIVIDGYTYPEGTPLSRLIDASDDLCEALLDDADVALSDFRAECSAELGFDPFTFFDPERVARDFALSRNGHGTGFFDNHYEIVSTGPEGQSQKMEVSTEMQRTARAAGTHTLSLWVDTEAVDDGDPPLLRLELFTSKKDYE